MTLLLVLSLLLGTVSATLADDQTLADLRQTNALLQAEYALAREGKPYLLIDLQANQIQLRVSGLALDFWAIDRSRRWGQVTVLASAKLERKASLDAPERAVQIVSTAELAEDGAGKGLKAFELADMPTTYRLHLENGMDITVRQTPVSWSEHLRSVLDLPVWYLSRPLISNWNFLRGSPYNELALSLSEQDARKLYWAFSEGTPCLIRFPAAVAVMAPKLAETK